MNIVWIPYIVAETVMSETKTFLSRGAAKTFAMVAMNDNKASVEEAVQSFECLEAIKQLSCSYKPCKKQ